MSGEEKKQRALKASVISITGDILWILAVIKSFDESAYALADALFGVGLGLVVASEIYLYWHDERKRDIRPYQYTMLACCLGFGSNGYISRLLPNISSLESYMRSFCFLLFLGCTFKTIQIGMDKKDDNWDDGDWGGFGGSFS